MENRKSFRTRLTIYVIGLALVPLALFGGIVASQFQTALTEQVNSSLASDAETIHQLVADSNSDNYKNVQSWAEDAIVRGALIYNAFDKSDTTLKVLQGRFPEFRVLVLFGLDGRAVSASDAALRDLYVAHAAAAQDADWFKAA